MILEGVEPLLCVPASHKRGLYFVFPTRALDGANREPPGMAVRRSISQIVGASKS